ncbi:MAG: hypothetical protein IPL60_08400 [Ardenticatenia bacterium]|nr:hypothetical protein [Ardenticatenia bacterium]
MIWRKLSSGTDSEGGSRFAERILTVVTSLKDQHRDSFAFLADAFTAHATGCSRPLAPARVRATHLNAYVNAYDLPILLPGRRGMLLGDKWAILEKGMMAGRGSLPIVVPSLSAYDELIERMPVP